MDLGRSNWEVRLDGEVRSAGVEALEDSVLLSLDGEAFGELMADHPQLATGVIKGLTARLRERTADVLASKAAVSGVQAPTAG